MSTEPASTTTTPTKKKPAGKPPKKDSMLVGALMLGILALLAIDRLLFDEIGEYEQYSSGMLGLSLLIGLIGTWKFQKNAKSMSRIYLFMTLLQLVVMGLLIYFKIGSLAAVIFSNILIAMGLFFASQMFGRDV